MDNEEANNLLERMLTDSRIEPTDLPVSFLRTITNNLCGDLEIGRGGFATVYEGKLQNGSKVAVKMLTKTLDLDEEKFERELDCLMRVNHKNIVRFLGYCADTQGKVCKHKGKNVVADKRQRFLCFEFLPGSLDTCISDASEGLEWGTRYNVIKGICDGLNYLHQQRIVHSDLKPANILLDHSMVPKIADFGLSRCFDENQTRAITSNLFGTLGYMDPDCYARGITFKSDIYSLGVIIIEILTGHKGRPEIEGVLENWRNRQGDAWLQHVRVCAEIGKECMNPTPNERPDMLQIIERLDAIEREYGFIETQLADKLQSSVVMAAAPSLPRQRISAAGRTSTDERSKPLDIYPPDQLRFPWEPNKRIECPVTLTNRTGHFVAVCIIPAGQVPHSELRFPADRSLYETMEPHSTWAIAMAMAKKKHKPSRKCVLEVVMAFMGSSERLQELNSSIAGELNMDSGEFLKRVESLGGKVHRVTLKVDFCIPENIQLNRQKYYIPASESWEIRCIDVHPMETLILVAHEGGRASISNYQTKEKVMPMQVTRSSDCNILSAKFIAGKGWFAVGDEDGWVHIHDAYPAWDKVKEFQAHDGKPVSSLAVHPTQSFLLTASTEDTCIKLWNWSLGWMCTRSFKGLDAGDVSNLMFNPWNTNTFASIPKSRGNVKVWNISRSDPTTIVEDASLVNTCCFSSVSQRHFLLTLPTGSCSTKIWDLQTQEHVHQLEMRGELVRDVACHPTLPLLATRTEENHLCFWDARTYRLEKMLQLKDDDAIGGMVFMSDKDFMTRLIVPCKKGILITQINLPTLKK